MRPLIEIQTIPIEIQMKTTNAHLEYARGTAQMEVSSRGQPRDSVRHTRLPPSWRRRAA